MSQETSSRIDRTAGGPLPGGVAAETFGTLERYALHATDIAGKAAHLVGGDREKQHGTKRDNFEKIAAMWNAWLSIRRDADAPLDAHDVGQMMVLVKLARTQHGSFNIDDYIDQCGYAACAGEVAQADGQPHRRPASDLLKAMDQV